MYYTRTMDTIKGIYSGKVKLEKELPEGHLAHLGYMTDFQNTLNGH